MIKSGTIISYFDMCQIEGFSLQRGMNFQVNGGMSIILMSRQKNAPYFDRIEDDGSILIYEGHDIQSNLAESPKLVDQPRTTPTGLLTQNGKFENAALSHKNGSQPAELVKVYEKLKSGIWVYNGIFELLDAWLEKSNRRNVFKFKLFITNKDFNSTSVIEKKKDIEHNRIIPTSVKLEVYKRDKGCCVKCGSSDNIHFDHILPFSKGGTSLKAENIQILCARHNLQKRDKIE